MRHEGGDEGDEAGSDGHMYMLFHMNHAYTYPLSCWFQPDCPAAGSSEISINCVNTHTPGVCPALDIIYNTHTLCLVRTTGPLQRLGRAR